MHVHLCMWTTLMLPMSAGATKGCWISWSSSYIWLLGKEPYPYVVIVSARLMCHFSATFLIFEGSVMQLWSLTLLVS